MKITPEDMHAIRMAFQQSYATYKGGPSEEDRKDIAIASVLIDIYERGYNQGYDDREAGGF